MIPTGDNCVAVKPVLHRHNLMVNETKKADFISSEAVRDLNRLLRFKKGQQENAAALPEADLAHSMAALSGLVKHLNVIIIFIIYESNGNMQYAININVLHIFPVAVGRE